VKTIELADGYNAGRRVSTDDWCRSYVMWAPTRLPDGARWNSELREYAYDLDDDPWGPDIRREVYRPQFRDGIPDVNADGEELWTCS
jgi:hypothetical protein